MPELPEVEATCRRVAPAITGKRIASVRVLRAAAVKPQRPATFARLARGRRVRQVRRRGKNILIDLDGGLTIRIHLRMTGHLRVTRDQEPLPATRLYFDLGRGTRLVFRDSRALGRANILTANQAEKTLADLGPEPLSREFTLSGFLQAARRSRRPAKLFLMDQKHVAGLGNIYAAEALFRAGIHPARPMNRVSEQRVAALYHAIRDVLREAVESALAGYDHPGGVREAERFKRSVYGREGEPCPVCGRRIRRVKQGGRSTYFCPGCQK